jgi:pimeloyl-ACP methyl ester carboxylesterase
MDAQVTRTGGSALAVSRSGAGPALVLLPGIGLSRSTWAPVMPALGEQFDVLAVDLPGGGDSPPLPHGVEPEPAALARAVADALDAEGIERPHVVGNSLGGWVALELAAIRPVASLTLLSPAGLWDGDAPRYCRASLRASHWLAQHAQPLASRLAGRRLGRALLFAQTVARPSRLTADEARLILRVLGASPAFDATLAATTRRDWRPSGLIEAPVTVAFGSRDRLLLRRQSRHVERLPAGTTVARLPGCGHVPMGDDPAAVVRLIAGSAARAEVLASAVP